MILSIYLIFNRRNPLENMFENVTVWFQLTRSN